MNIIEPENLKKYAHILDGKVVNVSLWDGELPYTPDEKLVEIPEGTIAGIGFDYKDGKFTDKRPEQIETAE